MVLGGGAVSYERDAPVGGVRTLLPWCGVRLDGGCAAGGVLLIRNRLQGCLAHREAPPHMTPQQASAVGPAVVLGGGGSFL